MIFYTGMFIFLLLLFLVLLVWKLTAPSSFNKKVESVSKNSISARMDIVSNSIEAFFSEFRDFWIGLFTVLGLPFLIYFLLIHPSYLGKEMGQKAFEHYRQLGCTKATTSDWKSCFHYSNPSDPQAKSYEGLLVAASNSYIAIFDGKKVDVILKVPEYVLSRHLQE